jgi:hypothetical protein
MIEPGSMSHYCDRCATRAHTMATVKLQPGAMAIPLTQGQFAIVDAVDFSRLSNYKWYAVFVKSTGSYYARRNAGGGRVICMEQYVCAQKGGLEVDHRNGNSLDNRRQNLRRCTRVQNCQNRRLRSDARLPYKGVQRRSDDGRFRARICVDGVRVALGSFATPEAAALAYDHAARFYFGEFARLNSSLESES